MALDTESSSQFADSDDDDDGAPTKKPKKKTSDGPDVDMYKSALSFKAGKGSNTSLYYVNYNTAKSGDGLDFDQKHKLAADIAAAECEEKSLKHLLTTTRLATEKLLTEPKNDELNNRLLESEVEMTDLLDKICAARKLTVNEAHKTNTKKRIEHYAAFWRKRRRICMDFLFLMEETSDGLISAKKCLAGDGPIDCESDELIAKNVVAFGKSKRANVGGLKATFANTAAKSVTGVPPSDGFVAMLMDSKGTLKRVYLDEPVTAPK